MPAKRLRRLKVMCLSLRRADLHEFSQSFGGAGLFITAELIFLQNACVGTSEITTANKFFWASLMTLVMLHFSMKVRTGKLLPLYHFNLLLHHGSESPSSLLGIL
jgi:hypothetical protein